MSTKATIAYGPNFHLYHEALDEDYVYLELEGVHFEASYQRVMVPIPVHIWEIIRRYPGIDLSFVDQTDGELRRYVEGEVDERIARYRDQQQPVYSADRAGAQRQSGGVHPRRWHGVAVGFLRGR